MADGRMIATVLKPRWNAGTWNIWGRTKALHIILGLTMAAVGAMFSVVRQIGIVISRGNYGNTPQVERYLSYRFQQGMVS